MTFMVKRSNLDDPDYASFAWKRYWRLMGWMVGAAVFAVVAAFTYLLTSDDGEFVTMHMLIATALGVFFSVMLAAALMGLVFLSSGTGHDESIDDSFADDIGPDSDIYTDKK